MDLIKLNNQKFACFSILIISIVFVFAQGISNNYFVLSAEGTQPLMNKEPKIITIQDNSDNDNEMPSPEENGNTTGGSTELPDVSNQGNETEGGLTGGPLSSESLSGTNQSEGDAVLGGESDGNQTVQTENQMNQNVNQTTNQNVNVNQTTNQNVNIENKQRLELIISEEEGEAPISIEEQTRIESQDKIVITEHRGITGPECRAGNVLAGATNAEDLRVLAECQDATGTVMHTKKMDDGDYKFFLNVDEQFKFLVNEKNNEKTEGFLVVEIVPDHQTPGVFLPKDGDRVHVWGAWVTDKPKGWHEIHPAWQVVKQ
ncbi:MAG: hypothetical protein ABR515_07755 [Nitrososphaeraceae archaeon]